MDVLDKYKDVWKKQPKDTQTLSKLDIYKLTQKKSTSIVKWIFIIGLIEFALIIPMYFIDFPKGNNHPFLEKMNKINTYLGMFLPIFVSYFIYLFYRDYKSISASDNTKTLMSKILKTRKTVHTYVILNLVIMTLILVIEFWFVYQKQYSDKNFGQIFIFIVVAFFVTIIILLIALGIYKLIYGILLKKLKKNYKELAKLEASS